MYRTEVTITYRALPKLSREASYLRILIKVASISHFKVATVSHFKVAGPAHFKVAAYSHSYLAIFLEDIVSRNIKCLCFRLSNFL